ncbi:MAG: hypothetical protein U0350_41170 [Caldilineaceae bacterium]
MFNQTVIRPFIGIRFGMLMVSIITIFGFTNPLHSATHAPSHNGSYKLALIHVLYSDVTSTRSSLSQLTQAGGEMEVYFNHLSYGNLNLTVRTGEATLSNTSAFYWVNCRANENDMRPCARFHQDVYDAAVASGFDFSDIDGIVYVSACGIRSDVTEPFRIDIRGRNFTVSYDYDCGPLGTGRTPGASDVWWNGWAHEIGHQLQVADGTVVGGGWFGHPSGYASGYDLMDSGYPNHESAYGLSGAPIMNGAQRVFPGWLTPSKVVAVNAPTSGSFGQTIVLAPLSQHPSETTAAQAIKIPLSEGRYYFVEARRRLNSDNYNVGPGIYDEGVHILEVVESRVPPVRIVDSCDTLASGGCIRNMNTDPRASTCNATARTAADQPAYCWPYPLWHVGEAYFDPTSQVEIRVVSEAGNGYAVTVTRGVMPGHPDVFLIPWLTPPMNTWETVDIWVDSSCNGYEDTVGSSGLLYGRRADGSVIGNGDDPCANHENRIYARVRNGGDRPADNVQVNFRVTNPLGVGVRGDTGWTVVGTADASTFPALRSIPPGGFADVFVNWTPSIAMPLALSHHFSYHSCVQVQITPVAGEIVTSNQDGAGEQENFENFELVRDDLTSFYQPLERSFFIRNPAGKQSEFPFGLRRFRLQVNSQLPAGWDYQVGDGSDELVLDTDETRWIPVKINVPAGTPIGQSFNLEVSASTDFILENNAIPSAGFGLVPQIHRHLAPVAGVVMNARTVEQTKFVLKAQLTVDQWVQVEGNLQPAVEGFIALDFTNPQGFTETRLVSTDKDGRFSFLFAPSEKVIGAWSIRGIWQGNLTHASAVSDVATVNIDKPVNVKRVYLPSIFQ